MSPSYHLPTYITLLFCTSYSTRCYSSVVRISPATLRHCGLDSSSFIVSIFSNSFSRVTFILVISPASWASLAFMYSWMYLSDSLKAASKICRIFYRMARNSLLRVLDILELKMSILELMLEISLRIFRERFSRHWLDSTLALSKLEL